MNKKSIIISCIAFVLWIIIWLLSYRWYMQKQLTKAFQEAFGWNNTIFTEKTEKKWKDSIIIPAGWEYIYKTDNWWEMKLKIREVIDYGDSYNLWWSSYKADKWFIVVRVESENVWTKPAFVNYSEYTVMLESKNWMQFRAKATEQVSSDNWRPEWYWWCIGCESNPWDKNVEDIIFDLEKDKIDWWKIALFDDEDIRFQL